MITSRYIEQAVDKMASLQGVGRKTALRYVLDLLGRSEEEVGQFAFAMTEMRKHIKLCKVCYNVSDTEVCHICSNHNRDQTTICVVEDMRDVMALESTLQFKGLYHVLGGKISPMEGIGPSDLQIDGLIKRLEKDETKEVILALSPTMEGDTTSFYLFKKMKPFPVITISTLSRGVSVGDELQYADEVTLGRSLVHRTPYENALS